MRSSLFIGAAGSARNLKKKEKKSNNSLHEKMKGRLFYALGLPVGK